MIPMYCKRGMRVYSFPEFQAKFFPEVAAQQAADTTVDPYCSYNSQKLAAFTSVLFLAGQWAAACLGNSLIIPVFAVLP